jgi:hypothetical protein
MKLKSRCFHFIGLIGITIVLNACGAAQNQTPTLQPSPTLATSNSVSVTLTLTPTITATIPATPTSWINALLTATPTMVVPLSTLPPDCGVVNLGRAGTQTVDNLQKILVQGTVILCGQVYLEGPFLKPLPIVEAALNLDAGTLGLDSADILFCPGGGTMIFYGFCNLNNSFIRVYSLNGLTMEHAKEPTFDECQSIAASGNDHDNEPEYACVITNLRNISRIKVEQYNPLGKNVMSLEISFITWKK